MATSAMVINVLDRKYAEDCRIKGSIAVPLNELEKFVENMPRETEIIVYCARYTCPMSHEAYKKLQQLGFTNIKAYEGGMQEWVAKGLPHEGPCEMDYLAEPLDKPQPRKGVETISAEELVKLLPK
jgi:rhodanese-related sulfurtransferase